MASFAYCMLIVFCFYQSIYQTASDATLSIRVDNTARIYLSRDGLSWTEMDFNITLWEVTYIYSIPEIDITPSTIIKFECTNSGGPGGFIANINYNSVDYYTTNPIDSSLYELVSSSDGIISPLQYT
eukprot:387210_1